MHVSRLFQEKLLHRMIEEGMVSSRHHPSLPLRVLNYTNQCQIQGAWNDVTLQCRGLWLDNNDLVVARCMPKPFNIEEYPSSDIMFEQDFLVFDKLDGSMIVAATYDGMLLTSTRGTFESWQAETARIIAQQNLNQWNPAPGYTYIFEYVSPMNQIVLRYPKEDLVFLTAIHNETGANVFSFGNEYDWPGTHAQRFDFSHRRPSELKEFEIREDAEGYMLYFPSANTRVKAKFSHYVEAHRVATNLSNKAIWELLRRGEDLNSILELVPDEFYAWVTKIAEDFQRRFNKIQEQTLRAKDEVLWATPKDRKEMAELVRSNKFLYSFLVFKALDGNDFTDDIWKLLKPQFERPTPQP